MPADVTGLPASPMLSLPPGRPADIASFLLVLLSCAFLALAFLLLHSLIRHVRVHMPWRAPWPRAARLCPSTRLTFLIPAHISTTLAFLFVASWALVDAPSLPRPLAAISLLALSAGFCARALWISASAGSHRSSAGAAPASSPRRAAA
jgi:hypothetical protein